MKTRVVNVRTTPAYDVYVGRAGKGQKGTFGNPYLVSPSQPRGECVKLYEQHFLFKVKEDKAFRTEVERVIQLKRDKARTHPTEPFTLGCFCSDFFMGVTADDVPFTCHGQVIAKYIDERCP